MDYNFFIKDQIDRQAAASHSQLAFIAANETMSFGELKSTIGDFSSVYKKDLSSKTPVLVYLPMGMDQAIVIASLLYNEIPALVLPTGIKSSEVSRVIEEFPFTAMVTNDLFLEKLGEKVGIVTKPAPRGTSVISLRGPRAEASGFDWLLYTSGSTGQPKMVMMSFENLVKRTLGEIRLFEIKNNNRLLNLLPFSHDLGLNQLLTSLCTGSSLEILVNKLPFEFAQKISQGNFDGITGMPQIWNNFIQIVEKTQLKINYSGFITISGGSMSEENLVKLREIFSSSKIFKTYGQTETFRTLAEDRQERIEFNECGRVLSNVGVLLLNDNGKVCKVGEVGQLIHYGDGVMNGYWQDQKLTDSKLQPLVTFFPEHSNVHDMAVVTGDYFQLLPGEEFQYVGRKDDMIKHAGRRFFLGEIEECINKSKMVQDVCVVQTNDDRIFLGNEKLTAFIIPGADVADLSKKLRVYCANNLESFKVPDEFILCESFPHTSSHKINRLELLKKHGSNNE